MSQKWGGGFPLTVGGCPEAWCTGGGRGGGGWFPSVEEETKIGVGWCVEVDRRWERMELRYRAYRIDRNNWQY